MLLIKATLLSDGSSDRALIPILEWLLQQQRARANPSVQWFDPAQSRTRYKTLAAKITQALEYYPCDILFIHRDAESRPLEERVREIETAWTSDERPGQMVQVIPVRMTEAWLLFDEACIRKASGCPSGRARLDLPKLAACEGIADPKQRLHESLRTASEKSGRPLKKLAPEVAVHRLAELIPDFSPLRHLPAFQRLETEISRALTGTGRTS